MTVWPRSGEVATDAQIEFPSADQWWIVLQERVIKLTGRVIEDLTPERLNSLRIKRLTEIEQRALDEYKRRFPSPIITQATLREALNGPDRLWKEEEIRLALMDGTQVEPGPIIAFLRRYKPEDIHGFWCFGAQIRKRCQPARKSGSKVLQFPQTDKGGQQ